MKKCNSLLKNIYQCHHYCSRSLCNPQW